MHPKHLHAPPPGCCLIVCVSSPTTVLYFKHCRWMRNRLTLVQLARDAVTCEQHGGFWATRLMHAFACFSLVSFSCTTQRHACSWHTESGSRGKAGGETRRGTVVQNPTNSRPAGYFGFLQIRQEIKIPLKHASECRARYWVREREKSQGLYSF